MKKISLFAFVILLCFYCIPSFAQDGFFLQPEMGMGTSGIKIKYPESNWIYPPQHVITYNPQILIGYSYGKWNFITGISFLRAGYFEKAAWADGGGVVLSAAGLYYKEMQYYNQLMLPVQLGYRVQINKQIFFNPTVGGGYAYNYSTTVKAEDYHFRWSSDNNNGTLNNDQFNETYKRSSVYGIAVANFGYELNKHMSLIAGPEVQYMLTSILKDKDYHQHVYAYTFNAGVTWRFKRNEKVVVKE